MLFLPSCQFAKKESIPIENLLPRETDFPGWSISQKPVKKTGERLKNHLSGRYELYKLYTISSVAHAEYSSFDDSKRKISVEIFSARSPLNAYGIMSYERHYSKNRISSADLSYITPFGHYSCKGQRYIRISASVKYNNSARDLLHIARIISFRIEEVQSPIPNYLKNFGKVKDFTYIKPEDSDIPSLNDIFMTRKNILSKNYLVLYKPESNPKNALNKFLNIINDKKSPFNIVEYGKTKIACRKMEDEVYIFITLHHKYIIIIKYPVSITEGKIVSKIIYDKFNI